MRIIGFSGEQRGPDKSAAKAAGGGKFSVVPYGGSKPEYPNVRRCVVRNCFQQGSETKRDENAMMCGLRMWQQNRTNTRYTDPPIARDANNAA